MNVINRKRKSSMEHIIELKKQREILKEQSKNETDYEKRRERQRQLLLISSKISQLNKM